MWAVAAFRAASYARCAARILRGDLFCRREVSLRLIESENGVLTVWFDFLQQPSLQEVLQRVSHRGPKRPAPGAAS